MQVNFNPAINSFLNNEEAKEKAKVVAVPAILSAGSAFIASKAPKDALNPVKITQRLSKGLKAGVITAAVMALLTVNKDKIIAGINNLKDKFTSKKADSNLESNDTIAAANVQNTEDNTKQGPLALNTMQHDKKVLSETNMPVLSKDSKEAELISTGNINPDELIKKDYTAPKATLYNPQPDTQTNPFASGK